jgi:CRP-like cAMP-binding protein
MVRSIEDRKRYADLLEAVPTFRTCSRGSLEQFVAENVSEVTCNPGSVLTQGAQGDWRLIVLVSGSALMTSEDDICTALAPGDYFGGPAAVGRPGPTSVVTAISEVRALVVGPQACQALTQQALRPRVSVLGTLQTTARAAARRRHRREVLVRA